MKNVVTAITEHGNAQDFAGLTLPDSFKAVTIHKDEAEMFAGLSAKEKDPRKSLHIDTVPFPELAPGEALIAVMASSINYNTVWTSIFELHKFRFVTSYKRTN